jgi:hypothetical protein
VVVEHRFRYDLEVELEDGLEPEEVNSEKWSKHSAGPGAPLTIFSKAHRSFSLPMRTSIILASNVDRLRSPMDELSSVQPGEEHRFAQ